MAEGSIRFIKPWVEDIDEYIGGKTIEGKLKLASNENRYGPGTKVVEALKKIAGEVYMYPDRGEKVKAAVARYVGVDKENVLIGGNGSDEIMGLIFHAFYGPVVGVYPSFSGYPIFSKAAGTKYSSIKAEKDFSFNCGKFISDERFKEANIVFLASPNNPTGGVISREDIISVLEQDKLTVVDEAYYEFYGESAADLVSDYDNLIVLRTFSKAFGLAGLRVGYCISNAKMIKCLSRVQQPFSTNLMAQEAVIAALDNQEYMLDCVEKIKADRMQLFNALEKKYRPIPSFANFILVDVSPISSQKFFDMMVEKGFVTRVFGKFEGFEGDYVRISIGTKKEMDALIRAL